MRRKLRGCALTWNYRDHRDGESAQVEFCGLVASVQDMDGDGSVWEVRKKGRHGPMLASGSRYGVDDFVEAAAAAEFAMRTIIVERIDQLRSAA